MAIFNHRSITIRLTRIGEGAYTALATDMKTADYAQHTAEAASVAAGTALNTLLAQQEPAQEVFRAVA